jgi:transcriptional regulator with XRE-family HTH domain
MNKLELQAEMKRKNFTYESLAKVLGISHNSFWRKINGMNEFTLSEVQKIVEALNINESKFKEIFLP